MHARRAISAKTARNGPHTRELTNECTARHGHVACKDTPLNLAVSLHRTAVSLHINTHSSHALSPCLSRSYVVRLRERRAGAEEVQWKNHGYALGPKGWIVHTPVCTFPPRCVCAVKNKRSWCMNGTTHHPANNQICPSIISGHEGQSRGCSRRAEMWASRAYAYFPFAQMKRLSSDPGTARVMCSGGRVADFGLHVELFL